MKQTQLEIAPRRPCKYPEDIIGYDDCKCWNITVSWKNFRWSNTFLLYLVAIQSELGDQYRTVRASSWMAYPSLSREIFTIFQIHPDQLCFFILIQNKVLHPRHTNEMTIGRFPPFGGSFQITWSFGRAALKQTCGDWNISFSLLFSHLIISFLCYSLLFSSHIICLRTLLSLSLPRSSSLCLCSNLAVSHLVIVVPKSHFLGRNTLAEGCSAITCRITRLSLTISWETGDNGLPWTRPSWQLAPSQTLTQRV